MQFKTTARWMTALRLRDALRSVESDLLGWEFPPIDLAIAEAPIAADPAGTWCLRCGETVGTGEQTERGCASCRGSSTPLERFIRLGEYQPPLSTRVLQIKYARWHAMAGELGRRLGVQVRESLPSGRQPAAVVSMPMPWLRSWWRGIDHASEIASGVASQLGIPLLHPLIQRPGPTQTSRSRTERRRATDRIFVRRRARDTIRALGSLLIVDDVRTTGASVHQAALALQEAGASEVIGAVLAVVPNPRRRIERGRTLVEECRAAENPAESP